VLYKETYSTCVRGALETHGYAYLSHDGSNSIPKLTLDIINGDGGVFYGVMPSSRVR
jgi:hypothetical protein